MPISVSAKKSLRVAQRQAQENKIMKARLKNQLKKTSSESIGLAFSIIDKAAKQHVIHPNKAARLKSKLAKQFVSQGSESGSAEKPAKKKRTTKAKATKKTNK